MSQIDWSKAPEDATHHGRGEDCCYWAKCVDGQQYFINIARWDNGAWKQVTERYDEAFLTARPNPAWTGEGLPPVGTVCELKRAMKFTEGTRLDEFPAGTELLVGGHANFYGNPVLAVCVKNRNFTDTLTPECVRQIRTPEQIAKAARSKACDAMYGIMSSPPVRDGNRSDMAEALYDAGYRKFEITDE